MRGAENFFPQTCGKGESPESANIIVDIHRSPAAIVIAEIVTVNAFVDSIRAKKQSGIFGQRLPLAQVCLPALVNMIVFENEGLVAEQDKFVGVPPKAKVKFRFASQILFKTGKPGLCSLPRIERPIKLVRAEGL